MSNLDLSADYIDVREITERVEELESEIEAYAEKMDDWQANADNTAELATLKAILDDLRGNGGDHDWRGDWYPVTLIDDTSFTDYTREMLEDCGYIPNDFPTWIEVDWDATARNVRVDYTSTEIDGRTYWYR